MTPFNGVMANPSSDTVNPGDSASFTCSGQGGPGNAIFWIMNTELPATRNFTSKHNK